MPKITSPNLIDKSAAISLIDTEKKPVIFWDTCSLLDIVRIPLPERNNTIDLVQKVIEVKSKIVSKDILSLSSALCVTEFNNHIERWIKELENESKRLSKSCNTFIDFINKINFGAATVPHIDLSIYKVEDVLVQIIHAIVKETLFIKEDASFAHFAHFRTTNKVPPAKKKGEYKDCYVWGTCLEVRHLSSDKSYSYSFMSSNTTDYADNSKSKFVTEIDHEASLNNITYFPNFKMAYGLLKRDGAI